MAYAEIGDLEDRLDFTLDEAQLRMGNARLEDASIMAAHYAGQEWADHLAPKIVRTVVLNVVERYMRNPDGYVQSRAGDETVSWTDRGAEVQLRFTEDEIKLLGEYSYGPANTVGSVGVYAHRREPLPSDEWVPCARFPLNDDGSPRTYFPLFSSEDAFWWGK